MNNLVEINNVTLGIKEFQGQRVITFKDIDNVHNRPEGTARKAFNRNRKHLIKDVDYFILTPQTLENTEMGISCPTGITVINPRGTTFVTETGYLMITKVFTDDLAWNVQRQLVSNYFQSKEIHNNANNIENKLIDLLSSINDRLTALEENQIKEQSQQPQTETTAYKKPYNQWFAKMQPKYKLLEDYFDITRGKLYHNILLELENSYNIDTQQIYADYCYENNLTSCYPLEPYEFIPKYRNMIEQIINTNLIKYGIVSEDDPIVSAKHITIFDTPIEKRREIKG